MTLSITKSGRDANWIKRKERVEICKIPKFEIPAHQKILKNFPKNQAAIDTHCSNLGGSNLATFNL